MNGIILIGFMGAGKTTVGRLLSQETGMEHIDFDDKIVEEIGMTIQEYFDRYGEAAFREHETKVLKRYLNHQQVVSTGGGIVMREENRALLKQMAPVIYLKTEPEVFIARLKQDHETIRPLVVSKSPDKIKEVFEPRVPLYEESASLVVETNNRTPQEIVAEILTKIK
jgi:shikimate kinase